jgi:hypothetical protein
MELGSISLPDGVAQYQNATFLCNSRPSIRRPVSQNTARDPSILLPDANRWSKHSGLPAGAQMRQDRFGETPKTAFGAVRQVGKLHVPLHERCQVKLHVAAILRSTAKHHPFVERFGETHEMRHALFFKEGIRGIGGFHATNYPAQRMPARDTAQNLRGTSTNFGTKTTIMK